MPKIVDWSERFEQAIAGAPECACGCGSHVTPNQTQLERWKRRGGRSFAYSTYLPGHQNKQPPHVLTLNEYQVLAGSSLGDGCITRRTNTYAPILIENHSPAQEEYVQWKAVQLSSLKPTITYHKNGGYGDQHVRLTTKAFDCLTWLLEARYPEPNRDLIESLDALGWAVWFMDDGSGGDDKVRLCTNGRSLESIEMIRDVLKTKWGLDTSVNPQRVISFLGKSREAFLQLISPHVIPSMEYKLDWRR